MLQRSSLLPVALLVLLGTSWGLRVSLIKLAAESGIPHATIAGTTTLGVAAALLAINLLRGRPLPIAANNLGFFALCALLGYVVPFFLQLYAAARVPAGTLALVFSMLPIATLGIALVARTDRITAAGIASMALGAASVAILLLPEAGRSGVGALEGIAAALCVPVAFGIYYNYVAKRWPAGLDSIQIALGEVLAAIPMMLPIYLWSGAEIPFAGTWSAGDWAVLVMIVFWTLDTWLYFEIVRLAGPVFTAQGNYVMLVSGVAWGAILFGERPTPAFWISLALVLAALVLLGLRRSARS